VIHVGFQHLLAVQVTKLAPLPSLLNSWSQVSATALQVLAQQAPVSDIPASVIALHYLVSRVCTCSRCYPTQRKSPSLLRPARPAPIPRLPAMALHHPQTQLKHCILPQTNVRKRLSAPCQLLKLVLAQRPHPLAQLLPQRAFLPPPCKTTSLNWHRSPSLMQRRS
jgi:hypothetical protein